MASWVPAKSRDLNIFFTCFTNLEAMKTRKLCVCIFVYIYIQFLVQLAKLNDQKSKKMHVMWLHDRLAPSDSVSPKVLTNSPDCNLAILQSGDRMFKKIRHLQSHTLQRAWRRKDRTHCCTLMSPSNRQVTKDISSLKGNLLRKGSGVSVNLRCTDRQISSSPRCSPHHVVFRCHFCNAEQVHMADQAMFPLIAPVRRSMRRWLRDLFDTSRPYTGDGGLVMDMSPSPLMPSFLIEHEPGFCGSFRQNLNHEFLGGSKQLFWCQKYNNH